MRAEPSEPDYSAVRRRGRFRALLRPLQYALFFLLLALAGLLPVRVCQRLGAGLGGLLFVLARRTREICLYHLGLAFPEMGQAERHELARRCFRHLCTVMLEFLAIRRFRREAERWVQVEGEQTLREAHRQGRGVLVIMGHLGNWELQPLAFDQLRIPARAVGRFIVNPWLNKLLIGLRESEFFTVIRQESSSSSRELLRCLKAGDLLVTYMDLDTHVPGEFVDFFGIPAYTPRGAASLALRRGLPVVTGFGTRRPDGTHLFRFEAVTLPAGLKDRPDGVREATRILTGVIEKNIRANPEQWIWIHKRWRRRPGKDGKPVKDPAA